MNIPKSIIISIERKNLKFKNFTMNDFLLMNIRVAIFKDGIMITKKIRVKYHHYCWCCFNFSMITTSFFFYLLFLFSKKRKRKKYEF